MDALGVSALGSHGFTGLLVTGAAAATATSLLWLLLVLLAGLAEASTGGRVRALRFTGCPVAWRRRLLRILVPMLAPVLGLGAATMASASPAGPAQPGHETSSPARLSLPLDGLPLPDRQTDVAPPSRPRAQDHVVVRPGDTLWQLARQLLPAGASGQAVAALSLRLYAANRGVIGVDPDLIRPGQRLRVPDPVATVRAHPEKDHR